MYFVTFKRPEYVLFCMSPSERIALALDEHQTVQLLARSETGDFKLLRKWNAKAYSHTAFMAALRERDEPADPRELLSLLPADLADAP